MTDFIFGYQYYRAPTPYSTEWKKDLIKIKKDGFNTVKFWVQWAWANPEEGRYFWDDLDELMAEAENVGLKVVLNLILDVVPQWVIRKYPDSVMMTASGEKLYPTSTICRQIGGAPGVCFNNEDAGRIKDKFVEAAIKHFSYCKALYQWDIWNEPELTAALKRKPVYSDLVCFCPSCKAKFRTKLENKYGTIKRLNEVWGRNYSSFDDVEPPRAGGTYADMLDWRKFFVDTISADAEKRADKVRMLDKNGHEVHCHTVLQPLFNSVSCGADTFEIAKYCDSIGNSAVSDDFSTRLLLSAANGKPAFNSEVHIARGTTFIPIEKLNKQELYKQFFSPLFNGIKGFLIWQYRQEILGYEAPAWGVVDSEGENTELYDELIRINGFIQKHKKAFENNTQKARVAVYCNTADEIFSFNGTSDLTLYNKCITGAFSLFNDCALNVDFVNPELLQSEKINDYEAIYFPNFYVTNQKISEAVGNYIKNGGKAIFEGFFGMVDEESGVFEKSSPCCGLGKKLGIKLKSVYSCKGMMETDAYTGSELNLEQVEIFGEKDKCYGSLCLTSYVAEDVTKYGIYKDGSIAVFGKKCGKGEFVVFNSLFSCSYSEGKKENLYYFNKLFGLCEEEDLKTKAYTVYDDGKSIKCFVNNGNKQKKFVLDGKYDIVFGENAARITSDELKLNGKSIAILEEK